MADAYSVYSYNTPMAAYSYPSYNMFPYQGTVYPATYSQPSQQYQVVTANRYSVVDVLLLISRLVTIIPPSPHTKSRPGPGMPRTPATPPPLPTPATPPRPPPRAPGIPPRISSSSPAFSPSPKILTNPSLCIMPSSTMDLSPLPPPSFPPPPPQLPPPPQHHPLALIS